MGLFLAHAGADLDVAEELHDLLSPPARVFLDQRCLKYGDNWDQALPIAQQASRITVVLISGHTGRAYYEREEIAAAIAMARDNPASHRVVPIYLEPVPEIHYGLRTRHAMQINNHFDLSRAARELLVLLAGEYNARPPDIFEQSAPTLSQLETQYDGALLSPSASATFILRTRHHVRLEAKHHAIGVTVILSIDNKEVFKDKVLFASNVEKNMILDGVSCRFTIKGLAGIFRAAFSVAGQEIISL